MPNPSSTSVARSPSTTLHRHWLLLLALLLAAQALLLLNPGYFSHDELQWAAFASVPDGVARPWVDWFDWRTFQYRPLTFNAWLLLSDAMFDRPHLFHATWAVLGTMNAALLALLLRRAGCSFRVAATAALVFVLNPYAAYVHGWIATLADLLWVGIGLGCALVVQWHARTARGGVGDVGIGAFACVATAAALLAKEAAIVLPALALLPAVFTMQRRVWLIATLGSGVAVSIYLALRLAPVFDGAQAGSAYAWSPANVPLRWLEYHAFLLGVPRLLEVQSLGLLSPLRHTVLLLFPAIAVGALSRAGWRWALLWLLAGTAALGPVLILAQSANQYGYGFSAACIGIAALAWAALPRTASRVVAVMACVLVLHGVNIQWKLLSAGERQANFSPALAEALRHHPDDAPLTLYVPNPSDRWLYQRLIHQVPSYRGVPIGDRVRLLDHPAGPESGGDAPAGGAHGTGVAGVDGPGTDAPREGGLGAAGSRFDALMTDAAGTVASETDASGTGESGTRASAPSSPAPSSSGTSAPEAHFEVQADGRLRALQTGSADH